MPRHWLTISIVIVLVAASIMLIDSTPDVLQPTGPDQEDALLTGYLTGVRTTQYDEFGSIEYQFTAERMSHFQPDPDTASANDYTTIRTPFFTFFQADDSPWYVEAEQGRTTQFGEVVILRDDVRVWQEAEQSEPIQITTSELIIEPENQVAETEQFVRITGPRVVSEGLGMRADLAHETFTIFSKGSTVYEPNP